MWFLSPPIKLITKCWSAPSISSTATPMQLYLSLIKDCRGLTLAFCRCGSWPFSLIKIDKWRWKWYRPRSTCGFSNFTDQSKYLAALSSHHTKAACFLKIAAHLVILVKSGHTCLEIFVPSLAWLQIKTTALSEAKIHLPTLPYVVFIYFTSFISLK